MKYIRTKQGCIVDTTNMHPETLKWYQEVHLLKQADTIEELCDALVNIVYGGHGKPHWEVRSIYDRTWKKDYKNDSDWSIYGAIWTDKGLIYVAKMNDKGELELL